jgi:hypothetical protein
MTGRVTSLLAPPLAQDPRAEALRDAISSGPTQDELLWFWGGAALLTLIIGGVIWYVTRRDAPKTAPRKDYLTFAVDLLELPESDRCELLRIARTSGLDQPAAMLLSPMCLAGAFRSAAARSGDSEPASACIRNLCETLFDVTLPDPAAEAASIAPIAQLPQEDRSTSNNERSGRPPLQSTVNR